MKLVGINGFKQSGKGTTAGILAANYEGVVYEIGFADKLKIMAAEALGYSGPPRDLIALMDAFKLEGEVETRNWTADRRGRSWVPGTKITGRQYLQNFGERARQNFGLDFWVDQVLPHASTSPDREGCSVTNQRNLSARFPQVGLVAITDLRYPNEAERVRDLGGTVWEIIRPGVESDGAASEQPLPRHLVDCVLMNSGDLTDLEDEVRSAMAMSL